MSDNQYLPSYLLLWLNPVVDFFSVYLERYMGLPVENPSGYEESSVMHHVNNMADNRYYE